MKNENAFLTQFSSEDVDDFNLDALPSDNKEEQQSEEKQDDSKEEESLEESKEPQEKEEKQQEESHEDSETPEEKEEAQEKDSKKETEKPIDKNSKKEEKKVDEDDLFSDFKLPEEKKDSGVNLDFKSTLSDLDISIDENEDITSKDAFINKVKQTIERSKQTLDLSKFPPEVKMIIDSFQKNPEIGLIDFYRNETIRKADSFLALSVEEKAKASLKIELRKSVAAEDLEEMVEDKMADLSEQEIAKLAKEADRNVMQMRNKEFSKVVKQKNEWLETQAAQQNEQIKKERTVLKEKLSKMDSFFGIKLPEHAKKVMDAEIDNGTFQNYLDENVADAKILAYLGTKLGKKLEEKLKTTVVSEKNKAYKEGTDSIKKQVHNIATKSPGQSIAKRTTKSLSFDDGLFDE